MPNYFDKVRIKVAAPQKQHIDLSCKHITTQDFGFNKPVFCRMMVPGDTFDMNVGVFTRCFPMRSPTFGNIKMRNNCFFVPFRILMQGFYEMMSNVPFYNGAGPITPTIPVICNNVLVDLFVTDSTLTFDNSSTTGHGDDFQVGTKHKCFTKRGRVFFDLLLGLGYSINWTMSDTTHMNALPFLAFMKIYRDWFVPSQYQSTLNTFMDAWFKTSGHNFTVVELMQAVEACIGIYDSDFFTTAYQTTNAPDSGRIDSVTTTANQSNIPGYVNVTVDRQTNTAGDTTLITSTNPNGYAGITATGLEMLEALTSFIRRNNHVGTRWVDQSLARFGVRPSDAKMLRSEHIYSNVMNIQISDVMSTAAGEVGSSGDADFGSSYLGDYAGKGLGGDSSHIHYESDEFGFLIITSCITCDFGYYQGRSPENLLLNRLDFYTPEYDSIGIEPIRNDYLFADYRKDTDYTAGQSYGGNPSAIFGYVPKYAHLKFGRDMLTGIFRVPHLNANMESFHLMRELPTPAAGSALINGPVFSQMNDAAQYDRIFTTDQETSDHFITIFDFQVNAMRPMHSLVDHLDVEGNGRSIEMSHYGAQL